MRPSAGLLLPLKPANIVPLRKNGDSVQNYNEYRDAYGRCESQYNQLLQWHRKAETLAK